MDEPSANRSFLLFVYGSLRRGGSNAGMLRDCECLGAARVAGALYDLDDYPALVLGGSAEVEGEIWRCPGELLARLDRFELLDEGVYRRVRVRIGEHDCWSYVAGPALASSLVAERQIASGCWPPVRS